MGPKPTLPSSGDLYRSRLDQILDQRHELFRLAGLIDWDGFDQEFGRFYRPLGRPAKPTPVWPNAPPCKWVAMPMPVRCDACGGSSSG